MLSGDMFSWVLDDPAYPNVEGALSDLADALRPLDFDVTKKDPVRLRDLFKGIYQSFVPPGLRHALGEYYTPDWLAAHVVDQSGWETDNSLLDPSCGSGTFLVEALRRRVAATPGATAVELLDGLYGLDLNPLAVLSARASLVVVLGPRLDPQNRVELPIYLADSVNTTVRKAGVCEHRILTEEGAKHFRLPDSLVVPGRRHPLFETIKTALGGVPTGGATDVATETEKIYGSLAAHHADVADLKRIDANILRDTVATFVDLHVKEWDGIWCPIVAERFAAGSIPKVTHVVGNPPWVKWANLPAEYAGFIKPRCADRGLFSGDGYVGGRELDICAVVAQAAAEEWLASGGTSALLLTGTLLQNKSSGGVRTLFGGTGPLDFRVTGVEDYKAADPFEDASNWPVLVIAEKAAGAADLPVPHVAWASPKIGKRRVKKFDSANDFRTRAAKVDRLIGPVDGDTAGPWLAGTAD
jgi:hypothetical protein